MDQDINVSAYQVNCKHYRGFTSTILSKIESSSERLDNEIYLSHAVDDGVAVDFRLAASMKMEDSHIPPPPRGFSRLPKK